MKTLTKLAYAAAAVLGLQACDPYTSENTGQPVVISVLGTTGVDGSGNGGTSSVEATPPSTPAGAWTIANMTGTATVIFVKTNKLLNGDTIQTGAFDCTPAGNWLHVNGVQITDGSWMTCYNPSSPSPNEGSSIVIYRGGNPSKGPTGVGWFGMTENQNGVFTLTGSVSDRQGHSLDINVLVSIADAPTQAMTVVTPPALPAPIRTDTTIDVSWPVAVAGVTTQDLQRSDTDASGNPVGNWTTIASTPTASDPFHDTGLTPGTSYYYRVVFHATVGPDFTSPSTQLWTNPSKPAAPTVTLSGGSAVLAFTGSAGATSYTIQRAPDSTTTPGTPGTFATIKTGIPDPTAGYTDAPAVAIHGVYYYRVVAVSAGSTRANSDPSAPVTFP